MRTGLLSIHAQYADAIFSGRKRFEYRRKAPHIDGPTRFLIYVPGQRRQLEGEIIVDRIVQTTPNQLWRKTGRRGGIDKDAFMTYFEDRDVANALHIQSAKRYTHTPSLESLRAEVPGGFTPPQYLQWLGAEKVAVMRPQT